MKVIPTIVIMKKNTPMMILMSLKCLRLLRNFYCTSGMQLMREWCMKCKIYMKTRMFVVKILLVLNVIIFNLISLRFPKLSDQYFDKEPWPSAKQVSTIMDDDKVL